MVFHERLISLKRKL